MFRSLRACLGAIAMAAFFSTGVPGAWAGPVAKMVIALKALEEKVMADGRLGIRATDCTFYDIDLKRYGYKDAGDRWLTFKNCRFVNCEVHETIMLAMEDCTFERCRSIPAEKEYETGKELDRIYYGAVPKYLIQICLLFRPSPVLDFAQRVHSDRSIRLGAERNIGASLSDLFRNDSDVVKPKGKLSGFANIKVNAEIIAHETADAGAQLTHDYRSGRIRRK